jgi:predicted transposase YdaD
MVTMGKNIHELIREIGNHLESQDPAYAGLTYSSNDADLVKAAFQRIKKLEAELDGETEEERQGREYRNSMYTQDPNEPRPKGLRERVAELERTLSEIASSDSGDFSEVQELARWSLENNDD